MFKVMRNNSSQPDIALHLLSPEHHRKHLEYCKCCWILEGLSLSTSSFVGMLDMKMTRFLLEFFFCLSYLHLIICQGEVKSLHSCPNVICHPKPPFLLLSHSIANNRCTMSRVWGMGRLESLDEREAMSCEQLWGEWHSDCQLRLP